MTGWIRVPYNKVRGPAREADSIEEGEKHCYGGLSVKYWWDTQMIANNTH